MTRISASPYPLTPFLWHVVADSPGAYTLSEVNTLHPEQTQPGETIYKPASTLAMLAAKRSYLGRIYLDWSQYPILTELPDTTDSQPSARRRHLLGRAVLLPRKLLRRPPAARPRSTPYRHGPVRHGSS